MSALKIKDTVVITWIWITAIVVFILTAGIFTFLVVSHKGDPTWDYRPVKDVPGESPHAVYEKLPNPQHIRGRGGN